MQLSPISWTTDGGVPGATVYIDPIDNGGFSNTIFPFLNGYVQNQHPLVKGSNTKKFNMDLVLSILRPAIPVLYAISFVNYLVHFVNPRNPFGKASTPVLFGTAVVHVVYCVLLGIRFDHHPMATVFEILCVVAAALACVYLLIELWRRSRSTGVFVVPFVLILQIASAIGIAPSKEINPLLHDTLFGIHTGSVALSYAAFFLCAIYAVMLLLFHRALRKKSFGLLFERLASLATLAKMNRGSALVGFVFLTVAIASGSAWAARAFEAGWLNPKVALTFVVWLVYGLALFFNYGLKWSNRRVAIATLVGFALLILSSSVVNAYLAGWHSFAE